MGSGLCCAQDVFLSPAFEHTSFSGDGYVDGSGASLGLRFPIADTRSTIELRPSYVWGTNVIRSLNYQREDHRAGAYIGFLRSHDIDGTVVLEYGVEAGFSYRSMIDNSAGAHQRSLTCGGSIGLRAARPNVVQPFLSLHPFYEQTLDVEYDTELEPNDIYGQSQFGLSLCVGLIFGLPSQGSAWDQ